MKIKTFPETFCYKIEIPLEFEFDEFYFFKMLLKIKKEKYEKHYGVIS